MYCLGNCFSHHITDYVCVAKYVLYMFDVASKQEKGLSNISLSSGVTVWYGHGAVPNFLYSSGSSSSYDKPTPSRPNFSWNIQNVSWTDKRDD